MYWDQGLIGLEFRPELNPFGPFTSLVVSWKEHGGMVQFRSPFTRDDRPWVFQVWDDPWLEGNLIARTYVSSIRLWSIPFSGVDKVKDFYLYLDGTMYGTYTFGEANYLDVVINKIIGSFLIKPLSIYKSSPTKDHGVLNSIKVFGCPYVRCKISLGDNREFYLDADRPKYIEYIQYNPINIEPIYEGYSGIVSIRPHVVNDTTSITGGSSGVSFVEIFQEESLSLEEKTIILQVDSILNSSIFNLDVTISNTSEFKSLFIYLEDAPSGLILQEDIVDPSGTIIYPNIEDPNLRISCQGDLHLVVNGYQIKFT